MQLEYRAARRADAAECVELRGKTRQNAASVELLRSMGITAKSWGDNIDSGALPGYICTANGQMVGYCFGVRETGEIQVMAVLPDFENQGIGRELLRLSVRKLADLGHRRAFLGCNPDPASRSHGFYRHLGWRSTGTFDKYGDEILQFAIE